MMIIYRTFCASMSIIECCDDFPSYSVEHRHTKSSHAWWHASDDVVDGPGTQSRHLLITILNWMIIDVYCQLLYEHYSCTCSWRCNGLDLCSRRISCILVIPPANPSYFLHSSWIPLITRCVSETSRSRRNWNIIEMYIKLREPILNFVSQ